MRQMLRMAVVVLVAAGTSSTAAAQTPGVIELSLRATEGEQAELSQRARQYLVTGYDADGPVSQAVETGCALGFRPATSGTEIGVFLRVACTLLEHPVRTRTVTMGGGRALVQEALLGSFEVEKSFRSGDGVTTPIDEPGAPLILATVRRLTEATPILGPVAQFEIRVRIIASGASPPGGAPLVAVPRLAVESGGEGALHQRSERRFLTGFRAGYPVTSSIETGCQEIAAPDALTNGKVSTTVSLRCAAVDVPISTFQVRTASGPQLVQQPVERSFGLSTRIATGDGQTVSLGGVREDAREALALFTATALGATDATEQFLVEGRVVRSGVGDPRFDGASYLAEVGVIGALGQPARIGDATRRLFVTGLRPDGPQKTAVRTGCDLAALGVASSASPGALSLAIEAGCEALEDPVKVVSVRTPHGPQVLQLPTTHGIEVSSVVTVPAGEALLMAGIRTNDDAEQFLLVTPRLVEDDGSPSHVLTEVRLASSARNGAETLLGAPGARLLEQPSLVIADGATGQLSDLTERTFVGQALPGQPLTDRIRGGCVFQAVPTLDVVPASPRVHASVELGCESIDQPHATLPIATPRGPQPIQLPTLHSVALETQAVLEDGQTLALGSIFSEVPASVQADPEPPPRERQESIVLLSANLLRNGGPESQVRVEAVLASASQGSEEPELGMAGPSLLRSVNLLTRPARESFLEDFTQAFFVTDFGPGGPVVTAEDVGCSLTTENTLPGDPHRGDLRLTADLSCRALSPVAETFEVRTFDGRRRVQLPIAHTLGVKTTVNVSDGQTLALGGLSSDDEEARVFVTPRLVEGEAGPQVRVGARLVREGVDPETRDEGFTAESLKIVEISTPLGVPATLTDFISRDVVVGFERGRPLVGSLDVGFEITVTPTRLEGGAIAADLQFVCDAVDEGEGANPKSRRPEVQRAFGHALTLDTAFEAAPGTTVAIAGASNGGDLLVLVTPHLSPSPASAGQEVRFELRLLRVAGDEIGASSE